MATIDKEVKEFLCMNHGEGDTSYAKNSWFARQVISTTKPMLENAIEDLLSDGLGSKVLTVADLGVFLNDLPGNDFNTLFQFFSANYQQLEGERSSEGNMIFIAGVPGSFYERLFPLNTLHFVYSSYSAHWLSRVPPGLTSGDGIPINKGKIYISKYSPRAVKKAYLEQFQEDFTLFLKMRSKELVPKARMLLTLHGRQGSEESCYHWELLEEALVAMVLEGLIEEEKLDSFNVPYYTASCEEVQEIIEKEGSFHTKLLVTFALDARNSEEDPADMWTKGIKVAKNIRSYTEPLISHHFGHEMIEPFFDKFTRIAIDDMAKESPPEKISISMILQRKD